MSTIIQSGANNIINAIKNPIGFILNASVKLPFVKVKIERVAPQEGQGIFVKCFTKHTSVGLYIACSDDTQKYSQAYPAKQAINNIEYNLFLLNATSTKIAVFFANSFLW